MKPFILFGSSIIIIVTLISAVALINQKNDIPEKHVEVVLRSIGDQLLLRAGDTTSRVMPVKKVAEHSYQISFQNELGFVSDTLINLVQRTFEKNGLAKDYIVNLKNCKENVSNNSLGETVFAFEINSRSGNLTACRGRKLDVGCYVIEIELLKKSSFNFYWLLLLLIPLGVIGYYVRDSFKKKAAKEEPAPATDEEDDFIPIGSFQFYPANNLLKRDQATISLTGKETKALTIFAANINQIVERETLMKAIWEEEGIVVISRNVDVLVSKLRKKLSDDEEIKFVNVHGRGYRFVVEEMMKSK